MSDLSYAEYEARDGRLCILKELAKQIDGRANERLLAASLAAIGYNRSTEWVRTQMRKLEELGGIRIHAMGAHGGEILVAEIRRTGLDHVERRSVIEGVAKPSAAD